MKCKRKITEYVNMTQNIKAEDAFQETELGSIPKDWKVVRLGDVVYVYDKQRIPLSEEQRQKMKGQYPYCGANGIIDYINHYIFEGEYILLAEDGGYWGAFENSAYIMNGKFWVNNHAHILKAIKNVSDNWFLMYVLNYMDISIFISGTTRGKLNQGVMKNIPIPLPPLDEQEKIAKVLGTIQRAIEQQDKIIEAAKNLKKSLMQKLFTEGIGHTEFKETEIGTIPASWEVVKLGDLGIFQYGFTTSAIEEKTGVKFLRITDIKEEGNIIWENVPYCELSENELEKYRLAEGDILFARIGATTGKTCIIESPPLSTFGSYLIRLQIKEKSMFSPKFIYYFTNTDNYWSWINANKEGKLKKGISASFLKTLPIPIPQLHEQQKIARILGTLDKKMEVEKKRKAAFSELFKTMLHKLMTGEIRLKDVEV